MGICPAEDVDVNACRGSAHTLETCLDTQIFGGSKEKKLPRIKGSAGSLLAAGEAVPA